MTDNYNEEMVALEEKRIGLMEKIRIFKEQIKIIDEKKREMYFDKYQEKFEFEESA